MTAMSATTGIFRDLNDADSFKSSSYQVHVTSEESKSIEVFSGLINGSSHVFAVVTASKAATSGQSTQNAAPRE
jgi:hypothetical protein